MVRCCSWGGGHLYSNYNGEMARTLSWGGGRRSLILIQFKMTAFGWGGAMRIFSCLAILYQLPWLKRINWKWQAQLLKVVCTAMTLLFLAILYQWKNIWQDRKFVREKWNGEQNHVSLVAKIVIAVTVSACGLTLLLLVPACGLRLLLLVATGT